MHCCPGSCSPNHNDTRRNERNVHANTHMHKRRPKKKKKTHSHTPQPTRTCRHTGHTNVREHEASPSVWPFLSVAQSVFTVQCLHRGWSAGLWISASIFITKANEESNFHSFSWQRHTRRPIKKKKKKPKTLYMSRAATNKLIHHLVYNVRKLWKMPSTI